MQTFFRAISLVSFAMSASIVGGGAYIYIQREAILENVKAQVTEHATEAITNALLSFLTELCLKWVMCLKVLFLQQCLLSKFTFDNMG